MIAVRFFSTLVAYRNDVYPALLTWQRHPEDPEHIARCNYAMERFEPDVVIEHVDFSEAMTRLHWRFLRITTPLVVIFIPAIFYCAVTRPLQRHACTIRPIDAANEDSHRWTLMQSGKT